MEENAPYKEAALEFFKKNPLVVGLVFFGILLCGVGVYQYLASKTAGSDISFIKGDGSNTSVEGASDSKKTISIDVEGEVVNPGVYSLPTDARVKDALDAAGGLAQNADKEYVSKRLNLAQKLIDGAKIYIPAPGETTSEPVTGSDPVTSGHGGSGSGITGITSLIDINSASEAQLDSLPKVGPVTASKIIANRPYVAIEELVSKKVMTQKTFDGLKDKITAQ